MQKHAFRNGRDKTRAALAIAMLLAGLGLPAWSAVIRVPQDYPTIVDAVGWANPGDEIVIEAGTYDESDMVHVWAPMTLRATNGLVTVRCPSSKDAVAEVAPGVTGVVFEGLKFERPSADANWMRTVQLHGASAATFNGCVFTGPANGVGVILFWGADGTFNSCVFSNFNTAASWAAAIFLEGADAASGYSDLVVRDSTFGSGCNGWIRVYQWNTGNPNGEPKIGQVTVSNCVFRATPHPHGIMFRDEQLAMQYNPTNAITFTDCVFEGTSLELAEFHYTGGGGPAELRFSRCWFKPYNSTRKMFWLDVPAPIVFENCLFGGGRHETIMTIWGGPPSVDFYHCTMINEGITGAESASGQNWSSFIWGWDGGRTFNVVNCLFWCPTNYSAAFSGDPGSAADRNYAVSHTVVDHPWIVGSKVQITAGSGYYTNVSLAGAFVNPAGGDYHLLNGTPWVNGGTDLGYALDLDRNARNQGGAPDLGAYESAFAPVTPTVSIVPSGANVVLHFTGVLQAADAVTGPYLDVPGAVSPWTVGATNSMKFFRARGF